MSGRGRGRGRGRGGSGTSSISQQYLQNSAQEAGLDIKHVGRGVMGNGIFPDLELHSSGERRLHSHESENLKDRKSSSSTASSNDTTKATAAAENGKGNNNGAKVKQEPGTTATTASSSTPTTATPTTTAPTTAAPNLATLALSFNLYTCSIPFLIFLPFRSQSIMYANILFHCEPHKMYI